MATKGSKKELSVRQEEYVALAFEGIRSKTSGAAITDEGDVRVANEGVLIECKGQFGELAGDTPVRATLIKQWEKIADEAYTVGYVPALALRFYVPDSKLADSEGFIDLVVRDLDDDAHRSFMLRTLKGH